MEEALLQEIIKKLDMLDKKISNFMGFFDLPEEEKKELREDVKRYKRGKLDLVNPEEAENLV